MQNLAFRTTVMTNVTPLGNISGPVIDDCGLTTSLSDIYCPGLRITSISTATTAVIMRCHSMLYLKGKKIRTENRAIRDHLHGENVETGRSLCFKGRGLDWIST